MYKFDLRPGKRFRNYPEDNKEVLKWLRPAGSQFHIYWQRQLASNITPTLLLRLLMLSTC